MKREIKFRAWDTVGNMMVIPEAINNPVMSEAPIDIHCFVLMQYVGMKDKNGKEIYEGDIDKRNGRICYDAGRFCFYTSGEGLYRVNPRDIEIIGNIHDNPELI